MKQLNTDTPWPSGCEWTVGLLDLSPAQLEESGIRFDRAEDDLDTLQAALLYDRTIGQLGLLCRDHAPIPGVEVLVDASISREGGLRALHRQLGIPADPIELDESRR
jgi:hypothetical protein